MDQLKSVTLLPASALPEIVEVVTIVVVEIEANELGALVSVVSLVLARSSQSPDASPLLSVAVAVKEYFPSLRVDDVMEKVPLLSAVAEPKRVDPLKSFTLLPASALPEIVGVVTFVVVEIVANELGALGAVVSMVIDRA